MIPFALLDFIIIICFIIIIITFFDKQHHMIGMSHLISEFYPNSEMPSTLLKMKAVPSNAAFCKHGTTRGMSIRFRCFSSSLETVPSTPTTIGTTTAFTSHCFSISIHRSWYFMIFSCSLAVIIIIIILLSKYHHLINLLYLLHM